MAKTAKQCKVFFDLEGLLGLKDAGARGSGWENNKQTKINFPFLSAKGQYQ